MILKASKKRIHLGMLPTVIVKLILNIYYNVISFLFPINAKKITFASHRSTKIDGNLLYIYEELRNHTENYNCKFLFKSQQDTIIGKIKYVTHLFRSVYHMATSHYFIVDDYYFPIYTIKPRKKTEIIQLWHAAGAFKKFGHSIVGKAFGPTNGYLKYINIHSNYTKVIVSSKEVIPFYAEAFQMPSANIYPLGLPRTDYFFDLKSHQQLKNQFYHDYPELKEKKVILYAPTFRSKGQNQNLLDYFIDLNVLRDSLGSDYALLIHLHPYVDKKLHFTAQFDGFVYQMQDNYSIEEILILSDLLITDYSSIIFDFSILNKPIGFYARDLESYTKIRDFYFDYENFVPGPIFKNTMKLTHWIKEENFELEKIQEFRKRFMKDCDGRVSQRVVEQIFNN